MFAEEGGMSTTFGEIVLLAERPELAERWAELHWREWGQGSEPGREELAWWVADAEQAVQRARVPVAFVALSGDGEVLGGVGLHEFDLEERRDRSPWVVGTIVQAARRGEGIGQALMARLETWVARNGIGQVWVATETAGGAVAFYEHCGYERVEELDAQRGERVTVLTKRLGVHTM
jgi:GNAT superfamily N-acetyltransferase